MQQETNADLKKEIEKRSILILILVITVIILALIEMFINPPFFLGLLLGCIIMLTIKFGIDSQDEYKSEW